MQFSYYLQVFLLLLVNYTEKRQQAVIEYLLVENKTLRQQLGKKRLRLTDDQRRQLAIKGKALGHKLLKEITTIVTPDTILRWHRSLVAKKFDYNDRRKKQGRPVTKKELEALIVTIAKENPDWGYQRIVGALSNLGHQVARTTIANILKRHGIEPAPKRPMRWRDFIKAHLPSIAACDFCTAEVWTKKGLTTFYILVVIDLVTRRIQIAGVTTKPRAIWMHYTAEKLIDHKNENILNDKKYLVHDRDTKFCRLFARPLEEQGIELIKLPPRSPNLNAHCERFIRSLKEECINKIIFFGEKSLRDALTEYEKHYHHQRNHQGLENRIIDPGEEVGNRDGPIVCQESLGGMLKYYRRQAA